MKNHFPLRTGELNYVINLSPPNLTGKWSVELGLSGLKESTWGISGCSGKLFDASGYNIGSYQENENSTISGSIFTTKHSIHQNGVILSNQSEHEQNIYDLVEVTSDYKYEYAPEVEINGEGIKNELDQQTHQYWSKENDDNIFFVTENADADRGFIDVLTAAGFRVVTGDPSGVSGGEGFDDEYGLIIFGSATSSGNYNSGFWNTLETNMMSLNSHLVTSENLGWYDSFSDTTSGPNPSVLNDVNQTAQMFPVEINYSGATLVEGSHYGVYDSPQYIWVESPLGGWTRMFYDSSFSIHPTGPSTPGGPIDGEAMYKPFGDTFSNPKSVGGNISGFPYPNAKYLKVYYEYNTGYLSDSITVAHGSGNITTQPNYSTTIHLNQNFYNTGTANGGLIRDIILDSQWGSIGQGYGGRVSNKLGGMESGLYINSAGTTGQNDLYSNPDAWNDRKLFEFKQKGRSWPQQRTYPTGFIYDTLDVSVGSSINIYTGVVQTSHGVGGEGLLYNGNSQPLCVWHKGFLTGNSSLDTPSEYRFAKNHLMCFSVTPTGLDWQTGYDMWSTLTPTGQRMFFNSVFGFFN